MLHYNAPSCYLHQPKTVRPRQRVAAAAQPGTVVREVLTRSQRTKLDPDDDRQFYAFPRLVRHVDQGFLDQVTQLYRERIQPGGAVLDLMSSWVSHLPPEVTYSRVVGHGMNAAELAKNPRLDSFWVRDLNQEPGGWAAADDSFDAVLCCVSVQYMQQPERVFAEVHRVLKPGGVAIFTFSNRMFYGKAIAAWREGTGYSRCQLVKQYFGAVEGFTPAEVLLQVPLPKGPGSSSSSSSWLEGLLGALPPAVSKPITTLLQRTGQDPFYAVLAYKGFKPGAEGGNTASDHSS